MIQTFDEIKRRFLSYSKEKQEFLIYQIYIAFGLYLDFIENYNKLDKHNLQKYPLFVIIYSYFYMFIASMILYSVFNKNSLKNKMRKIKFFANKFKN